MGQPGGLAIASHGYLLRPRTTRFTAGEFENLRFTVFSGNGQPVTDGNHVKIRQIGFYAGDEEAFRKLFATYLVLTSKMQERKP